MSTYDYRCYECDHDQVEKHGMMEEPVITCADCGSDNTRRVILKAPLFDMYTPGFAHQDVATRMK